VHFHKESNLLSKEIEKNLLAYQEMLTYLSKNIIDKRRVNDPPSISVLLKRFYIDVNLGKAFVMPRMGFVDISWYSERNSVAINRYGVLQTPKLFTQDIENALRTSPNIPLVYALENNQKIPLAQELYLMMGITNAKGEYIGKLVVLLDSCGWVNMLKEKLFSLGYVMAIIDSRQAVLFSTDQQLDNSTISTSLKFKNNEFILRHKGYVFLKYTKFPYSPYILLYGYGIKVFWHEWTKNIILPLATLWLSSFLFSIIFFLFGKCLRSSIRSEFIDSIEKLSLENKQLVKEKAAIISDLCKERTAYEAAVKYDKCLLKAYEKSSLYKEKLSLSINSHIAHSLVEVRELVKVFLKAAEGTLDIPISYDKQIEILIDIHNKLTYLSEFCVFYKEEDVGIEDVIYEAITVYAKDIFYKNIDIKTTVSAKVKEIRFNQLLFKQIIVSLLYICLDHLKPQGEIHILTSKKTIKGQDHLNVTIKYDGFHFSEEFEAALDQHKVSAISPIRLDLHTIKHILEIHNGNLELKYTNKGNIIYLTLPCKPVVKEEPSLIIEGGNVVLFKKV
jgi:hypothetical protein